VYQIKSGLINFVGIVSLLTNVIQVSQFVAISGKFNFMSNIGISKLSACLYLYMAKVSYFCSLFVAGFINYFLLNSKQSYK